MIHRQKDLLTIAVFSSFDETSIFYFLIFHFQRFSVACQVSNSYKNIQVNLKASLENCFFVGNIVQI